jgi:hypothetical protein
VDANWNRTLNQLVVANLMRVFSTPFAPSSGILSAGVNGLTDVNGDGYIDVAAMLVLRAGRGQVVVVRLVFDGLSAGGALIGQPSISTQRG